MDVVFFICFDFFSCCILFRLYRSIVIILSIVFSTLSAAVFCCPSIYAYPYRFVERSGDYLRSKSSGFCLKIQNLAEAKLFRIRTRPIRLRNACRLNQAALVNTTTAVKLSHMDVEGIINTIYWRGKNTHTAITNNLCPRNV